VLFALGGYATANLSGLRSNRFSVPDAESERGLELLKDRMNVRSDGAFTLIATHVESRTERAAVVLIVAALAEWLMLTLGLLLNEATRCSSSPPVWRLLRHGARRHRWSAVVRGQLLGSYPTSAGSSGPCKRSRPRWTAAMNLARLTSRVSRISSA
jgi:hypothetical protein